MTIFLSSIKRIVRSKLQLFIILIFPFMFMGMYLIPVEYSLKVAVVDKDKTELTSMIIENIKTKSTIKNIKEEDIEDSIINNRISYALVMDKGFTDSIISGGNSGIKSYHAAETNMSSPLNIAVESLVNTAKNIAHAANKDSNKFYHGLEVYKNSNLTTNHQITGAANKDKSRGVLGMIVLALLFTSLFTATIIQTDKGNMTFYRTIAASVNVKKYMVQNILSFMSISMVQIAFLLLVANLVFGVSMGVSGLNVYLLLITFSLVSTSMGIILTSFTKNLTQASIAGLCIVVPMAMLGGAYWPNTGVPAIVSTIAKFTPVSWVMDGVEKLLNEATIWNIGNDLLMLLVFAGIFFFFGTWRKEDVAK